MILADTSVVIDFLRTADAKLRHLIVTEPAAVCGVTRAEVLYGTLNPGHRAKLLTALNLFHQMPFPDVLWDAVGDNLAALRTSGVTVPFPDVVIATVAIANDVELWTRDNQFRMIQGVLPQMRLFQEPP
jgi:predicted nucleic acid-binding protein